MPVATATIDAGRLLGASEDFHRDFGLSFRWTCRLNEGVASCDGV